MNIEELLTRYTDLAYKRDEAYEEFMSLDNEVNTIFYENETPIELFDIDGNPTGFSITTPNDLWNISAGTVIAVHGVEWLSCKNKWVNCYEHECDNNKMFIYIVRNRDYVHLIHRAY